MYVCMCVYIHKVCIYVYMYVRMYVCVCVHIYMYVCMYSCNAATQPYATADPPVVILLCLAVYTKRTQLLSSNVFIRLKRRIVRQTVVRNYSTKRTEQPSL